MEPRPERLARAGPPLLAALAALAATLVLAGATRPPGTFTKYAAIAAAAPAERDERALDLSPLYLAIVGACGPRGTLALQVGLHAVAAAAAAGAAGLLGGSGAAVLSGLLVALYRPLLAYAGVHEPETAVSAALALACWLGLLARRRIHAGAGALAHAAGAGTALALAGLLRPPHLLLLVPWLLWMAPPGRRARAAGAALPPALALVGPVALDRSLAAGLPVLMNPGPVFYEGNGPTASGLNRCAPEAVWRLELAHPEAVDYAHLAYRRVAAHALGGPVGAAGANRYWTGLALEAIRAEPGRAMRLLARKTLWAAMPYEAHDLKVAEDLDRRVSRALPWGFGLPLALAPAILLAQPSRRRDALGPLAVAALAFLLQVGFYASARQRLPLALGLLVAGPAALAGLERRRRLAALALGSGLWLLVARASGWVAIVDRATWDRELPSPQPGFAARLRAVHDGAAFPGPTPARRAALEAALARARAGEDGAARALLAPLAGRRDDWTLDEAELAQPDYWLARLALSAGDLGAARAAAAGGMAARPLDPRVVALAERLGRTAFPPAGVDPVSAALARAAVAGAADDARASLRALQAAFPELVPPGSE